MKKTINPQLKRRKFAFVLIILGAVMLLFRGTLTDYAYATTAKDGVYIPNSSYRFSSSETKDGMYSHTFRIYNLRPRYLGVEAQPDCGCTGVSWEKTNIIPFGWKDITAKMKSDNSGKGNSVAIGFQANSPHQPWLFAFLKS